MSNSTSDPSASVIADAEASLKFTFFVRTRIQDKISIDESSPYIKEIEEPMPAKTDVYYDEPLDSASVLTPAGYSMTFPIRRLDEETLEDKYQTALTYLDQIVTDSERNFNTSITIGGNDPVSTFNEHEDVLRAFGEERFDVEGDKNVVGTNKRVTLSFRNGNPVVL